MDITVSRESLVEIDADAIVVPVFERDTPLKPDLSPALAALDHLTGGAVESLFEHGEVDGKRDRWTLHHVTDRLAARRILLYGAGGAEAASPLVIGRAAGAAVRLLQSRGVGTVAFVLREKMADDSFASAVVEGVMMAEVNGDFYKSDGEPPRKIERLVLVCESPNDSDLGPALRRGAVLAEAANFARALAFEPGNVMTPTELSNRAEQMARSEGLGFQSLGEEEMKQLGMGALLAVSRGSEEPARLIALSYAPEAAGGEQPGEQLIALVGKGITFDSGGISIKPAERMEEMKYDMGGGAAVIAAMQAIARLRPAVRVLGLVPASENLPSGRAVKPGDVVRSLSGKTIEVINTDAEGRLVLADAMAYAISRGATEIVDVATLTGACVVALGETRAAVLGTDQPLIDELVRAGEQCGERLWQMPLDKEYAELIRSDIADVKNIGNRTAGAITAAMFLKLFAGELPWAHLDIAGTAWLEQAKPYMAKGATGFGARLLANFVLNRATQ